jgi:hypothetical protein
VDDEARREGQEDRVTLPRQVIATAVLPWMLDIYAGDESEVEPEVRERLAGECAQAVIAALVKEAEGDDGWVSGHDLYIRIGAIVLEERDQR